MTRLPKDFGSPQGRFTGEAQGKVARDPRRDRGDPVAGTAPPKGLLCTDRQPVAHHRRAGGDRGPQDQTDDPFSQRNTQDARHQRQSEVRAQPRHPPKRLASVCFGTDLGGPATARIVAVPAQHTSQRCSACGQVDPKFRENQAVFRCTHCAHTEHADVNAAKNILAAGLAVTACEDRQPPGSAGSSKQEPPGNRKELLLQPT